jgi:hypothetical protein
VCRWTPDCSLGSSLALLMTLGAGGVSLTLSMNVEPCLIDELDMPNDYFYPHKRTNGPA